MPRHAASSPPLAVAGHRKPVATPPNPRVRGGRRRRPARLHPIVDRDQHRRIRPTSPAHDIAHDLTRYSVVPRKRGEVPVGGQLPILAAQPMQRSRKDTLVFHCTGWHHRHRSRIESEQRWHRKVTARRTRQAPVDPSMCGSGHDRTVTSDPFQRSHLDHQPTTSIDHQFRGMNDTHLASAEPLSSRRRHRAADRRSAPPSNRSTG